MAKRGPKPKKQTEVQPKKKSYARALTTEEEHYALSQICQRFESMNEDQRKRAMGFFIHKYSEYLPETLYLTDKK